VGEIILNDEKNILKTDRVIPFEGVHNFRDMGGYHTLDGRKVKHGLFFRSADLSRITERDLELFKSLGIKYIFDYRDEHEAIRKPDPLIENVVVERVPVNKDKQQAPVHSIEELVKSGYFKEDKGEMLLKFYPKMAFKNPAYYRLMTIVQNPNHLGLVHHCAAGKDRTGIGAALIFLALGVPKDTIMEDYLITNETLKSFNEKIMMRMSPYLTLEELKRFEGILVAKEEYLEAVFHKIDATYGSTDIFLQEEYNFTGEKREKFKNDCLE
jgi:protein-tyrosine phosphatase